MPRYTYQCKECDRETDVYRSLEEYDKPPENGCRKCGSDNVQRIIVPTKGVKQFVLERGKIGGFEFEEYQGNTPAK